MAHILELLMVLVDLIINYFSDILSDTLDFSKLSLHSAKRLEMETLVKMLETEKQLDNERKKLAGLRRHHYQLAGELEGWEESVSIVLL